MEVHDTAEWGRAYRAPVGEDVAGTAMFEHSALLVMAARDGTRVAVDADADGTPEISVTLDEGQSHHVAGGVRTGATVTASEPVQVDLVTGDVCGTFQGRWFSLLPVERWSASAHTPVSTPREHRTTVHVSTPAPAPSPSSATPSPAATPASRSPPPA